MGETTYAWATITKAELQEDGSVLVTGAMSDARIDRDGQGMNQAWLDKAAQTWFDESANIREMHDRHSAAGTGVNLARKNDGTWMLQSRIVDPVAAKKCLPGPNGERPVYQGYSIGVREPRISFEKAEFPGGEVVDGYICEVSLADRPSNPRSLFTMVKADADGSPIIVDETIEKTEEPAMVKFVSAKQRRKMAKSGEAMPNGDFPIKDKDHLQAALGRLGSYGGDKEAAKAHIKKRAKALGVEVPSLDGDGDGDSKSEKAQTPAAIWARLQPELIPVVGQERLLLKYDESADIAGAQDAIACIARLIQSEASELAKGRLEESRDISILQGAVDALKYFISRETAQQSSGPDATGTHPETLDMAQVADLLKTEGDTDTMDEAKLSAIIGTAVTNATKDLGDRVEKLGDQLNAVAGRLDKVESQPMPGGPAQTRSVQQAQLAKTDEQKRIESEITDLLNKADGIEDAELARGYRMRAANLREKLDR